MTALKLTSFLLQLVGLVLSGGRLVIPPRHELPGADTPHFQVHSGGDSKSQSCARRARIALPGVDRPACRLDVCRPGILRKNATPAGPGRVHIPVAALLGAAAAGASEL